MKLLTLVLLAGLCAGAASADTCTPSDCVGPITYSSLVGSVKSPGDTFSYSFFVETFSNDGQGEAILNGTLVAKGRNPFSETFSADYFFFPVAGSDVLVSFGTWNLVATVGGAEVVDPPLATPEPSVLVLCLLGLLAFPLRSTTEEHSGRKEEVVTDTTEGATATPSAPEDLALEHAKRANRASAELIRMLFGEL